jgi:limonene 1,2-monooxygenase
MVPERLDFGIFMAPFHRAGENPTLSLRRDLELISWLDDLGYDEAWVGEHHSGGWETIASPEVFLAAAGERTRRIRLGTGVVSVPYHHPFNIADRIVLLDHLTRGRAMLGVGPGALPADASFLGIAAATQRPRMDEGLGLVLRLLTEDEPVTYKGEWFELKNAQLQMKPYQRPTMPIAVASTISPAGMTTAGKHGAGVLSVASYSAEGLAALPNQWSFCEQAAADAGQVAPDRKNWRVVLPLHIAETRDQAYQDVEYGLLNWNNEYFHSTLGHPAFKESHNTRELAEQMTTFGAPVIGTPDDLIARIRQLQEVSGGFGCVLGLAHEWASTENTRRSYELIARYVMPEVQDLTSWIKRSNDWTRDNNATLNAAAGGAIIKAITEHKGAAALLPSMQATAAPGAYVDANSANGAKGVGSEETANTKDTTKP